MVDKISAEAEAAYERIHASEDFIHLKKTFLGFVIPLTVAFMVWYVLYVLLSIYATGFMGQVLFGNINVALVFGLLQFVSTFGIAYWYAKYAAKNLDPIADRLRDEYEQEIER